MPTCPRGSMVPGSTQGLKGGRWWGGGEGSCDQTREGLRLNTRGREPASIQLLLRSPCLELSRILPNRARLERRGHRTMEGE